VNSGSALGVAAGYALGVVGGAAEGAWDGHVIQADELTFHMIDPLHAEAGQLIADGGAMYQAGAISSRVGSYALAVATAGQGVARLAATHTARAGVLTISMETGFTIEAEMVFAARLGAALARPGIVGTAGAVGAGGAAGAAGLFRPYAPNQRLPKQTGTGFPAPHPAATGPHSTLGVRQGRQREYVQTHEWGGPTGQVPIRRVDWTDHGRPNEHACPHQHPVTITPNGPVTNTPPIPYLW